LNLTKTTTVQPKELRSFGLIVGGIFALIALWPMVVRGLEVRWWAVGVSGALLFPAVIAPKILWPLHCAWMFIGHVLGWINTRIILAIGFYGILMPVGVVMRLAGKDPMCRKYNIRLASYRMTREVRAGAHMRQQF
jgi:hypothetical protein